MRLLLSILGLVVGSYATCAAAQPNVRVTSVLTATADVHDIASYGERTLLATSGGLVVRNGAAVERIVTSVDGLPGSRLRSVSVVGDDVWVGGVEGTARLRIDDEGVEVVSRYGLRRVRRVVRFAGQTWLASYGDGLHRLADEEEAAPQSVRLGSSHARRRLTDLLVRGDELWVGTASAGIARVDRSGRVVGRFHAARGLADDIVWDLEADGDRVLVATIAGLSVIEGDAVVSSSPLVAAAARMRFRDIRAVARVGDGVFVGTHGGGTQRIGMTDETPRARPVGRPAERDAVRVRVLFARVDTMLVGHDAGLAESSADGSRLHARSTGGLHSADVTALERAFGAIWVGTFHEGLARLERGRIVPVSRATARWNIDRRINDLAVTTNHAGAETLWIATDRGLYYHDGRRFAPVVDDAAPDRVHVTSLHVDRRGALWVTSSRMLSRRAPVGRWQAWTGDDDFPVMQLHAVTVDAQNRVWVGSLHGLYRFDRSTGRFRRHGVSTGDLPVDWVTAVVPQGNGIVAGTYHGGLSWLSGDSFQIEREGRGGIPAGWINPHAIRPIGEHLFIGTLERGLVVGTRGRWRRLRIAQGLPSDDVTDVLADGDRAAWVATRGGLARIRW